MTKGREGESPEMDDREKDPEELRKYFRGLGMTESQMDDMFIRLNAEEIHRMLMSSKNREPEGIYKIYEEEKGRPLTEIEKISIKEGLKDGVKDLLKDLGLDEQGKQKKDS